MKKRLKRRLSACFLSLVLAGSMLTVTIPVYADSVVPGNEVAAEERATENDGEGVLVGSDTIVTAVDDAALADEETLFQGYVDK